jgi:ABC-type proline/glycine betaine transport system ATPase subunit
MGYVQSMDDHRMPKRVLNEEIYGLKKRGRPRKRWTTEAEEDLRRISIQGWRVKNQDQQKWRGILQETKVHTGL